MGKVIESTAVITRCSNGLIGEMDDAEFNALIERFVERETQSTGEVPADVLFEALPGFFAAAESVDTPAVLFGSGWASPIIFRWTMTWNSEA